MVPNVLFVGTKARKEVGFYDNNDLPILATCCGSRPRAGSYLSCWLSTTSPSTPVASKALATLPGVAVSSATVRNVMSDLESMGLVRSPHTSAGKIPTQQGLRFFVDTLLSVEPWNEDRVREVEAELDPNLSPVELINTASELLSQFTQMTCLITTPRRNQSHLRQLEFLRLDDERVLVILVLNDRDVQNRVIHLDKSFSDQELVQAANLLNQEFGGRPLVEMREAVMTSMRADRERMDEVCRRVEYGRGRFAGDQSNSEEQELVVSGERRLLDYMDTDIACPVRRDLRKGQCCICWINVLKAVACNCILAKNRLSTLG